VSDGDAGARRLAHGQQAGRRFDDIFGVPAALAALEALDDAGSATVRPIDLVAWTNEEGVRFAPIAGAGSLGRSLLREGWHLSISNR
jgi:hypothetical protein